MIRLLLSLIGLAVLAALATKPSEQRVTRLLHDKVQQAIADRTLDTSQGRAASVAATAICKLDPDACADLILSGVRVRYENKYLFANVGISGFGRDAQCYAAFTTLFCPGGDPTG